MRTSFSNSGFFMSLSAVARILILIAPAVSRAQDDKIYDYDKELSIGLVHPYVQSFAGVVRLEAALTCRSVSIGSHKTNIQFPVSKSLVTRRFSLTD